MARSGEIWGSPPLINSGVGGSSRVRLPLVARPELAKYESEWSKILEFDSLVKSTSAHMRTPLNYSKANRDKKTLNRKTPCGSYTGV